MKKLAMKSLGRDIVWLSGSQKDIWRTVYTDGQKFFCIFYDQVIELVPASHFGYKTVEQY